MKTITLLKKVKEYLEETATGAEEPEIYTQVVKHIEQLPNIEYKIMRDDLSRGVKMGENKGRKEVQEKIIEALGLEDFVRGTIDPLYIS